MSAASSRTRQAISPKAASDLLPAQATAQAVAQAHLGYEEHHRVGSVGSFWTTLSNREPSHWISQCHPRPEYEITSHYD
jgi:hypothetical protein